MRNEYKDKSGRKIVILIILFFLLIIVAVVIYIGYTYTVTTVAVEGNIHYTDEEIKDMVMEGYLGNNSLYLSLKYRNQGVDNVPFVETMDVTIISPTEIKIEVYEKALAGYVEYLGQYLYFDKDGIVVESSSEKTEGVPQILGLKFGYIVLHEKLPVDNENIFQNILSMTKLLEKYGISADKIYFDSNMHMTMNFEDVRVLLGSEENIDEKIMKLQQILPELSGKKGTLQMENYTSETKSTTFKIE